MQREILFQKPLPIKEPPCIQNEKAKVRCIDPKPETGARAFLGLEVVEYSAQGHNYLSFYLFFPLEKKKKKETIFFGRGIFKS